MAIYWTEGNAKAIVAIRALSLTARYDRVYHKFVIDYYRSDPRWTANTAYYTPYPEDAIATAHEMERQGK
jgi:hypothetical protein